MVEVGVSELGHGVGAAGLGVEGVAAGGVGGGPALVGADGVPGAPVEGYLAFGEHDGRRRRRRSAIASRKASRVSGSGAGSSVRRVALAMVCGVWMVVGGRGRVAWRRRARVMRMRSRGVNPFAEHMRFLSEQLVLAGTGGKLTMLAESGSGTLAGGAHLETFRRIARGEARKIGDIIQRQVVRPFLEERFPGAEEMAYFELAFREEVESAQIVEDAVKLAGAGYRMDVEELSEKTGYVLEEEKDEGGDLKLEDEGSDRDLEERLRAVAEADDEGLEDALAVLNREFPAVGAVLGNGAPKGHEFYGNQYGARRKIREVVSAAEDGTNEVVVENYHEVTKSEAARLKEETGLDVSGYSHAVDNYSVRHIMKEHSGEKEILRGQIPVTKEDFEKIPEIVTTWDRASYAGKTNIGRDGILYEKRIGDVFYLIEETRTKRKTLVPVTLYKKRATPDAQAPAQTPETFRTQRKVAP